MDPATARTVVAKAQFAGEGSATVRGMRVGVLASGSGTILRALVERGLPVSVVVVDRTCGAIDIAAAHGVPVEHVERTTFGPEFDRVAYTHEVIDALAAARRRPRRDRRVRHDPVEAVRRRVRRACRQHPSVAAARVQGLARGARRARASGEGDRLHRAPRHRRSRRRSDPRAGSGARVPRTTPKRRCTNASRRSNARSTPT